MADIEVKLRLTGDGQLLVSAVDSSERSVEGLGDTVERTGQQAKQGFDEAARGADRLGTSSRNAAAELAAAAGGIAIIKGLATSFVTAADAQGQLDARVRRVSESVGEQTAVTARLRQVAHDAYVDVNQLGDSFVRSVEPMRQLGYETGTTLDLTEALALSMVVSASAIDKRASAVDALSKVMQTGVMRGEEFDAMLNGAPRFVEALESALGKTRAELIAMVDAGDLSAGMLAKVGSEIETLRAEVEDMPTTFEDAQLRFSNAFQAWAGDANEAHGVMQLLVGVIDALSGNIDSVMIVAIVAATGVLGILINQGASWLAGLVQQQLATKAAAAESLARARAAQVEAQAVAASTATALANARAQQAAALATGLTARASAELAAATAAHTAATSAQEAAQRALDQAVDGTSGKFSKLSGVIAAVTALALGYEVGTWARGFEAVRIAGDYMVAGMLTAFEAIKAGVTIGAAYFRESWNGAINNVREGIAGLAGFVASTYEQIARVPAFDALGVGSIAAKLREIQAEVAPTSSAWDSFSGTVSNAFGALRNSTGWLFEQAADLEDARQSSEAAAAANEEYARTGVVSARSVDAALSKLNGTLSQQLGQLDEQVATYGKGRVAAVEYARGIELAKAATIADVAARERYIDGVNAAYAPLIAQAQALDNLKASQEGETEAKKLATQSDRERAKALEDLLRVLKQAEDEHARSLMQSEESAVSAQRMIAALKLEGAEVGLTDVARRRLAETRQFDALMQDAQLARSPEQIAALRAEFEAAQASRDALEQQALQQQATAEEAKRAAEESAQAWQDFAWGLAEAVQDGSGGVKRYFKQLLDDLKTQLIASGLMSLFASIFNVGGGAGGGGMMSMLGAMMGGGGGGMGGGMNLLSMFGGNGGAGGMGGMAQYMPALAALAGGAFGFTNRGSSNGSAGSLLGAAAYGYAGYAAGTVALGAGLGAAGAAAGAGTAAAAGGALSGAAGAAAAIPVVGWIIAAIAAIDMITGGKVFGSRYRAESSTSTIGIGAEGGTASLDLVEVRNRALFQGRQWRGRSLDPGDEAREAAAEFFEGIRDQMTADARSLVSDTAPVIEAAIRTVNTYNKKGKITATEIFVDVLGQTFKEDSHELAAMRIAAEARIAQIDFALSGAMATSADAIGDSIVDPIIGGIDGAGERLRERGAQMAKTLADAIGNPTLPGTQPGTMPTAVPGEASAIAQRWRGDAELLAEGAEFLLYAAMDIRSGLGLLRAEGGLTAIADLIEDMQRGDETLSQTYARVSTAMALLDQALDMSGQRIDVTREALVRLATAIVDEVGSIERAGDLWSKYFQRFYTDLERAEYAITSARAAGQAEFSDIGRNITDYTGEGGLAAFRTEFEAVLRSGSAEAIAQWLEAAEALGMLIDAEAQLAEIRDAEARAAAELAAQRRAQLDELLAGVRRDEASFGLGDYERQLLETRNRYADLTAQAAELDATVQELAEIEAYRERALRAIADAALADYDTMMADIRTERSGGVGFAAARREIEQWERDTIAQANSMARAAGYQGAAVNDLIDIHTVAADRIAKLRAQLEAEVTDLGVQLGYTSAPDTLDSLNARIEQLSSASSSAASTIGQAVETMRGQMALLLGDLSPYNDNEKLRIARGGLQDGTVSQEQYLQIAMRLFGRATSRFRQEFEFAQQYAPRGNEGNTGTIRGEASSDTRSLAELREARDLLLQQQRGDMADTLARRIAELSAGGGGTAEEIAAARGWSLAQLGEDLGMDLEAIQQYIATLTERFKADDASLASDQITDAIWGAAQRIVDAFLGSLPGLGNAAKPILDPHLSDYSKPAPLDEKEYDWSKPAPVDPPLAPSKRLVLTAPAPDNAPMQRQLDEMRRELTATRELLAQYLPAVAEATADTAVAAERVAVTSEGSEIELRKISRTPPSSRSSRGGG